jgi:glycosyltransferase involved in cell wall biosynthesis
LTVRDRNPRLSIGLAVFNGEKFIRQAVESLLHQSFEDFQLIISDNASADHTEEICRGFAAQDSRVRYYRNDRNYGAARNFNRTFELAASEYFKWAAHDDVCAPSFLERCIDALDRTPTSVLCYTDSAIIDEHGHHVRDYEDRCETRSPDAHERFRIALDNFVLSNPLFGIVRSDAFRSTRLLGRYVASDAVLLAELALRGEIVKVPELLFYRRDHPDRAARANPTHAKLAEWYAPENREHLQLRSSRLLKEYLGSVWRAPISWSQRLSCYRHLAAWLRWKWRDIAAEVGLCLKLLVRSVLPDGRRNNSAE